jgi:TPR repeat protein/exonuclease VII small subunit
MGSIAPQAAADNPATEPNAARPAILAAARRVAERDGILELSLLSVAQEAGVAPGSVYACFSSKNDLLLSVIADDLGTLACAMREAFDTRPDIDDDRPSAPVFQLAAKGGDAVEAETVTSIAAGANSGTSAPQAADVSDAQKSTAQALNPSGAIEAIARLQETVARLETRPVDAWLERRLREFERALSALEGRHSERSGAEKSVEERFRELTESLESLEHRLIAATEDSSRSLAQRIDACENRLRGVASDTQADASTLATRVTALENAAFAVKPEFFSAAPGHAQVPDKAAEQALPDPAPETASAEPIIGAAAPVSSYLAAARKSAQAAAVAQDSNVRKTTKHKSQTMVYVAMGSLFLFVAMLTAAGLLLRNVAMDTPAHAHNFPTTPGSLVAAPAHVAAALTPQMRLRTLAEAGDPNAELLIGQQYLDGRGTTNDAAAFAWLSRAAARNQPIAQYELGVMYENGRGLHADPAEAFRWFESAALKGNRRSMHSLATAYTEGRGTAKNMFEAARWYGRAAQLGSVNDQFNLGVLFERGMGVTQSLPDAYKWYAIAAAQGDKESQSRIAAIAPMLAPEDLAAAQSAAQAFRPDALSQSANFPPTLAQKR